MIYVQLNFRKNDIITVTQQIDGGWWEGTLNAKTGWFPSDYVTAVSDNGYIKLSKIVATGCC
jgi:hypothetical protein